MGQEVGLWKVCSVDVQVEIGCGSFGLVAVVVETGKWTKGMKITRFVDRLKMGVSK